MKTPSVDKYIKKTAAGYEVRVTCEMRGQYFERRKRTLTSIGEARNVAHQFLAERQNFRDQVKSGYISWETAISDWEQWAQSKHFSVTTIHSAKLILNKQTAAWFRKPVSAITNEEIEQLVESAYGPDKVESKKGLLKHIRSVLRRQVQLGKIKSNPSNGIHLGRPPEKEMTAMTRSEILLLLSEAEKQNHEWYPIWRVTYELGLRAGEVYALKWQDFNFESGFVTIRRSYNTKSKSDKAPKNNRSRALPLNSTFKQFLLELRSKASGDYVFERSSVWTHGEQAKKLREFQRHVGIQETNFHSIRASFITHLLLAGVPLLKVKEMVGHRRTETTERYMRSVAADNIGATDALAIRETTVPLQQKTNKVSE